MSRARSVAVAICFALLLASPAAALSGGVGVDGTITVDATDGPAVDIISESGDEMVFDGPAGSNRVEVTHSDGSIDFYSDAPTAASINADAIGGEFTYVTGVETNSTTLTIDPADKESISVSGGINSVAWTVGTADNSETDFNYTADATTSISAPTSELSTDLMAVDTGSGSILDSTTTDSNGTAVFDSLPSGTHSVQLQTPATPSLTNPTPSGGSIVDSPVTLSVDVDDADFEDTDDSVTVTFYDASDDSEIGSETVTTPGTATASWSDLTAGQINWYAEATDQGGRTATTATQQINTPSDIVIKDEQTLELIDEVNDPVQVQFFPSNASKQEVFSRETTNGRVDMSGLPATEEFVVTADVDGYEPRRIVINSIIEQSTIYLANSSTADLVLNEFSLQDQSGQFPSSETKLFIQKPINGSENGTARYQTITGDYFGASERFPATLIRSERYRLVIENEAGDRRTLGAYTPESATTVPLSIGEITWPKPETNAWAFDSSRESGVIELLFNDPTGETSALNVSVRERGNASNVLYSETVSNPTQYQASVDEPAGETEWVVHYEITRNGVSETATTPIGSNAGVVLPVNQTWLGIFVMIAIVIIMAAFPGPLSAVGGVVTVSTAGMLMLLGWLQIPVTSWFVAATIAAMGVIKSHQETTL